MRVSLKEKDLANNMIGLYLDIYANGKPKHHSLNVKLYAKPANKIQREHNKKARLMGEQVRAKFQLDLQEGRYNINTGARAEASFLEYFKRLMNERKKNESNYGNWKSVYKHLTEFVNGKELTFLGVDDAFLKSFKDHLLNAGISRGGRALSTNSASSYLNKIKAALNQAYDERIITDNPGKRVKGIKLDDTRRQFLLQEELKELAKTECILPVLKRAFLFSCLTGLRVSDIEKLKWRELKYSEAEKRWKLYFTQKKTKSIEYHPINEDAVNLLGERRELDEKVFKGFKYSAWNNQVLQDWVKSAGIDKKITFHSGRHTYATLLLTQGGDIYTVSSLLGHKNIKTTQIYGKIIDTTKNRVVDLLPAIGLSNVG